MLVRDISLPDGVLLVSINGKIYRKTKCSEKVSSRDDQQWDSVEKRSSVSRVNRECNGASGNLFSSFKDYNTTD